ncbi:MAG: hypothetical protein QN120_13995 [Armatimonadota bacterium]|nr:hypothetical protein [Armatimonadota bacterium]
MPRVSIVIAVLLGVLALVAVLMGAARIVRGAVHAAAPLSVAPAPTPAGQGDAPAAVALTPAPLLLREIVRSVMPAIVSLVLLVPSSIVALSRNRPPEQQRWATATISSIVTYWLT